MYAQWPNYLNKIIGHVQELIERPDGPGTVGGLSGEGNVQSRQQSIQTFQEESIQTWGHLRDVLMLHWLYSSSL